MVHVPLLNVRELPLVEPDLVRKCLYQGKDRQPGPNMDHRYEVQTHFDLRTCS